MKIPNKKNSTVETKDHSKLGDKVSNKISRGKWDFY